MECVDADLVVAWIGEFARLIERNASYLTELDAAIGDADHGVNMQRGMAAAVAALEESARRPRTGVQTAGHGADRFGRRRERPAVRDVVPRMAAQLGAEGPVDAATFASALRAGWRAWPSVVGPSWVTRRCSTLGPASAALDAALAEGAGLTEAMASAAEAAAAGRDATRPLPARKGKGQLPRGSQRRAHRSRCGVGRDADRRGRDRRAGADEVSVGLVVVSPQPPAGTRCGALAQEMIRGHDVLSPSPPDTTRTPSAPTPCRSARPSPPPTTAGEWWC